jgi:hypothetical protein
VAWDAKNGVTYTANGQQQTPQATVTGQTIFYTYEKYNESSRSFEAIASAPASQGKYRVTAKTSSGNYTLTNATLEFSIKAAGKAN